jgi:hypothetical protein
MQLQHYFVSQSSEICPHNPLCCFSTSVYCYFVMIQSGNFWIHPRTISRPTSKRHILILSFYVDLYLTSGLFSSTSPTKILYAFLIFFIRVTCPSHLILRDLFTLILCRAQVQIMNPLTVRFYPVSCHFLPLSSKYSPQHPVLKHPRSMFLT